MEFYEVGGCVRDELLGVKSKDIDFTVVMDEVDRRYMIANSMSPYEWMNEGLRNRGFVIFLETPDFLTTRAQFPKAGSKPEHKGLTADFVLARKESDYTDGRRPDKVEPGTLKDDLARRDFTMNAIAKINGDYIDPFNGVQDIQDRIIRAVGDPVDRFEEDSLRIMRAMRFSVTKGFDIDIDTLRAMHSLSHTVADVSAERVREELTKMFNHDPMETIRTLDDFRMLSIIFDMGINFQPTMKGKIR